MVPPDDSVVLAFHGTSSTAADAIQAHGFIPSTHGMLGPGVYMSRDLRKVFPYAQIRGFPFLFRCLKRHGTILHLRVSVGRVITIDHQGHSLQYNWQGQGYDTAWAPRGCGMVASELEEACVADPSRIQVVGREDLTCASSLKMIPFRNIPVLSLILPELCHGFKDLLAATTVVLLMAAPWRLVQTINAFWRHVWGAGRTNPSVDGAMDEVLLQPGQLDMSWRQIVAWHALAALMDLPCLVCAIVLTLAFKLPECCRKLSTVGGYFGWGARCQDLVKPQLLLLRQARAAVFCS